MCRISKALHDSLPDDLAYAKVINGGQLAYYTTMSKKTFFVNYEGWASGEVVDCFVLSDGTPYNKPDFLSKPDFVAKASD